ncbi:L-dopachrome tautomerase yellow-f2-like [Lutzomyia longipalpis]|uniref:L-dopachrome tautomerase yellow-f2-like n=1 Tax=Lutzomyia longipalpis TaxID=7200 RepID=UPI0016C6387E|nr:L-dopachrome tautomerase yellow-f2-like [Lutzomyia longipalpis]
MRFFFVFLAIVLFQGIHGAYVEIGYSLRNITFDGLDTDDYNPKFNIPTGLAVDPEGYRLFIAIPRRKPKVPYTVAELNMVMNPGFPVERAPSFEKFKKFNGEGKKDLVNVYQPVIDDCRRLWVLDIGKVEYTGGDADQYPKGKPTLIAYDLKKDHTPEIHRFEIPDDLYSSQVEFGGFAVDVVNTKGDCTESFVYLTNFKDNSLIVYDETQKKAWKFTDKTFEADKESTFSYSGEEQMKYKVGLFGIALGDRDEMGHRPAYYIAGSSTKVYSVNTKELKTENGQLNPQLHGDRGKYTDAIALAYDPEHKVLYFAESDSRQVSCWNVNMELKPDNTDVIFSSARFTFGTDILVDSKGMLWIMANGHPPVEDQEKIWKMRFVNRKIRIMKVDTERVFKYSRCNPNYKPPKEIEV